MSEADDVLRVNDTGECPIDYRGYVLVVSDHGNCEFYNRTSRDRFISLWSCV